MPDLKFRMTLDASGMEAGVARAKQIASTVGVPDKGQVKSNARVASTMFVSAIRDSFASLASGQNPLTILLQQAPQVAQGFTMMGAAGLRAASKFLGIGAAAVALAGGLYWLMQRLNAAREALKSLADLTNTTNLTVQDLVSGLNAETKAHMNQVEWLRAHAKAQDELKKSMDEYLDSLKEKQAMDRKIAEGRGASPSELMRLETSQLKEQLRVVQEMIATAKGAKEGSVHLAELASGELKGSGNAAKLALYKRKIGTAADVAEAVRVAMIDAKVMSGVDIIEGGDIAGGPIMVAKKRAATAEDVLEVEVANKKYSLSLAQATKIVEDLVKEESALLQAESDLTASLKERRAEADRDKETLASLQGRERQIQQALGIKDKYGDTLAMLGGKTDRSVTSREQVGLGAAPATFQISLLDISRKSREHLSKIEQTMVKMAADGEGSF